MFNKKVYNFSTGTDTRYTLVDDNDADIVYTEASISEGDSFRERALKCNYYPFRRLVYFHSFGTLIKEKQHKGYGRKMLQYVKSQYQDVVMYLAVGSCGPMTNEQLIEFYKSEGFKELPPQSWTDCTLMAIEL